MRPWGALGDHLGQKMSEGSPEGTNGDKMEPKLSQNGTQNDSKINQKSSLFFDKILERFWARLGGQKAPKMSPNVRKTTQKHKDISC